MLDVSQQPGERYANIPLRNVGRFVVEPVVGRLGGSDEMSDSQPEINDGLDLVAEVDQRIGVAAMTTRFHDSRISDAIRYHLAAGGNRTRARIAFRFGRSLGLSVNNALPLAVASEAVHNASLILDDLQDRDSERRGQPSVWMAFGPEVASLASHLLVSAGFSSLADPVYASCTGDLVALFHSRIASTVYGQETDLFPGATSDTAEPGDESVPWSSYVRGAIAKSGGLLSLPIEMPLIAADRGFAVHIARRMMGHFATAYQIIDDLADVARDEHRQDKSAAPNAVSSLRHKSENRQPVDLAFKEAAREGKRELDLALDLSHKIPGGCYSIISDECSRLLSTAEKVISNA
ncbi:MAG: polyprenyl synthetase family protein [Planctomycetota bacterium]|nr:polyprenyl synthetase family protein [Planctomycetota bacterium]